MGRVIRTQRKGAGGIFKVSRCVSILFETNGSTSPTPKTARVKLDSVPSITRNDTDTFVVS